MNMSNAILARFLLLCELLIEKGLITDEELLEKLSPENIGEVMKGLKFGGEELDRKDTQDATN